MPFIQSPEKDKAISKLKEIVPKELERNIGLEDFTCDLESTDLPLPYQEGMFSANESYDNADGKLPPWAKNVRICACLCDKKRKVSLSVRASCNAKLVAKATTKPGKAKSAKAKPKDPKAALYDQANAAYTKFIFDNLKKLYTESLPGLIVISGRTNCAKTVIVKSIIKTYINDFNIKGRKHHIVTCEDPIEFLIKPDDKYDYTPREIGKDVKNLRNALKDAKRQTPSCVFVGEVRTDQDWREVIDFAGTGHFIITTTHSGSLRETFTKIFRATKVKTSFDRRYVSGNILACMHLRSGKLPESNLDLSIPTAWFKTCESINEVVSHGISSLTPNGSYSFSRNHFAALLADPYRSSAMKLGTNMDIEELFR